MYLAHLEKLNRIRLADVLVEEGLLQRDRVEEAQAEQEETGKQLGEILVAHEILTEYDLAKLITTRYSLPYIELSGYSTKREVVTLLPLEFCEKHMLFPLDQFGSMLTIAVTEMPDQDLIQSIIAQTKLTPCLFVTLRNGVSNALAEEKKRTGRQNNRTVAPAAAKAPPAGSKPPAVAAAAPTVVETKKPDLPLPEFDLPIVSMKLVGVSAAKVPVAPLRVAAAKETPVAAKPANALGWMDTAAGTVPAAGQTPRARVTKFGSSTSPGLAAAQHAPHTPHAPHAAPASSQKPAASGGGAWQSIFDVGDGASKKPK